MKYASWLFGIASVWAGILNLIFGDFEAAHQPIQAWGDHIPGIGILARIAAVWLIVGGAALMIRPAARVGATALAILYTIFCLFPLPRLITAPHFMGYHANIYIGVFVSVGQQVIVLVGSVLLCLFLSGRAPDYPRLTTAARWLFGLSCVDFGLAHFAFMRFTTNFMPAWIPFREFWTIFTGIAFMLAGLAIITGIRDVLATRLTALMLLLFSVLVLTPRIFDKAHDHVTWGSDAYNLTAVGATWIFAVWLQERRSEASAEMPALEQHASA